MRNSTEKLNIGKMILIGTAIIAFWIGAGFSTGQEILQYYCAWGSGWWISLTAAMVMIVWAMFSFYYAGKTYGLTSNKDIYTYYCGKKLGIVFDIFGTIFCGSCTIYMLAGAGSTLNEQFGIPTKVGTLIVGAIIIACACLGLKRLMTILGYLGIPIIILIFFVVLYNLFANAGNIPENIQRVNESYEQFDITRCSTSNAFMAGVTYIGGSVIWMTTFISQGAYRAENKKNYAGGVVIGVLFMIISLACYTLSMFSNVDVVGPMSIPTLTLAKEINAGLGVFYAIVVICAIFTTTTPLFWTTAARVAKEGTSKYTMWCLIFGIASLLIALFIPYKTLVNVVLTTGGYVVMVFWVFIVIHDIRMIVTKKNNAPMKNETDVA